MKKINSGIYEIVNNVNGKRYIGSSSNLKRRLKRHKRRLKNNNHANRHLQSSVNKYGLEKFSFQILERLPVDELLDREQSYLDLYIREGEWFNLYNIAKDVSAPMYGLKHTKEARKKISEYRKGKKLTWESRKKISETQKGKKNNMYGKKHTEETRKRMSESQKGKKHTEKTRKKISEATKSKKLTWEKVSEIREKYSAGGITQKALGQEYGVSRTTIGYIINNVTWKV